MRQTFTALWALTSSVRSRLWWSFGLALAYYAFRFMPTFLFKALLDGAAAKTTTEQQALLLVGAVLVSNLVVQAIDALADGMNLWTVLEVERDLRLRAHTTLLSLSLGQHERENSSTVASKITRGIDKVVELIFALLFEVLTTCVQIVLTIVILAWFSLPIAGIFLLGIPPFLWLTLRIHARIQPLRFKQHDLYEAGDHRIGEDLRNIHTVQSFAREEQALAQHREVNAQLMQLSRERLVTYHWWNALRTTIQHLVSASILALGILALLRGMISAGTAVLILTFAERAFSDLFRLSRIWERMADATEPITRLVKLFATAPALTDAPDAIALPNPRGIVRFEDVSYAYAPELAPVLLDVTFDARPGMQVALVGPSGAGKSTVTKLLLRHDDVSSGRITLDGHDLRTLRRHDLRAAMAVVPQDLEVFDDTVLANIRYARPDAPADEVDAAARAANAHDVILGLPKGYETRIGEDGVKLSGGQRQRLAIARALLVNPRVLVLDEATSHLDAASERLIQDALENIRRDRTVLVVAHRLSTVMRSDLILVFENGRIVERGDHTALLRRNGLYARLVALQEQGELAAT